MLQGRHCSAHLGHARLRFGLFLPRTQALLEPHVDQVEQGGIGIDLFARQGDARLRLAHAEIGIGRIGLHHHLDGNAVRFERLRIGVCRFARAMQAA